LTNLVTPAQAGAQSGPVQRIRLEIPAFAGMTVEI
jgi:hypothetical protein